jgi:biopolymer transport protein ExbB
MGWDRFVGSLLTALMVTLCLGAAAQDASAPAAPPPAPEQASAPAAPAPDPAPAASDPATVAAAAAPVRTSAPTITLWWMLEKGGVINWLILAMSVVAVIMALYFVITLTPSREVPQQLVKRAQAQIRAGDLRGAYEMCEGRDELFARVLEAGLRVSGRDRFVIQEAMESEGERGATALWQKISYLNNIGAIAPLLGLLGTVWGMIRAFSGIAFENTAAKGLVMAEGVAQAMITTACGLMLAIPALLVYYYLRGRVIKIVAEVEAEATEIVELLARREAQ